VDSRWTPLYGDAVSTPSDPQRGGQQPESAPDSGRLEKPAAEQPGEQGNPEAGHPSAGGHYGQQPAPQQPGQYGQPSGGQYGGPAYGGSQYPQPGQYASNQYPHQGQYPNQNQYGPHQYGTGQPYGQAPQYGQSPQYGQAPEYGQQQKPGQQPVYGQPGYGSQPYGAGSYGQPAYSPYGTPPPYPAGLSDSDVESTSRPGIMGLALALLILSALPFLAVGALMAIVASSSIFPPEILNDPRIAEAGITAETLVSFVRVVGVVMAGIALLYVVFAVQAFRGRNWARVMVVVMTIGFVLLLLFSLLGGTAGDASSLIFLVAVLAASVGGTVLLFLPASARFFANPRR
jgi:hypothetical protein